MNQKSYDAGLLFGTLVQFVGCVALWDWPVAMMVTGSLVVALTLIGAVLSRKN